MLFFYDILFLLKEADNVKKIETDIKDCYILEIERFGDERGYFTSITENQFKSFDFNRIVQVSNSLSQRGVLRGLHFQKNPYNQSKIVRCHHGAVLCVAVDLRKDSDTYKKYITAELSEENKRLLYIPRGFGFGFLALENDSLFEYYVDNEYAPRLDDGIPYNDKDINIPWDEIKKEYNIDEFILSNKDQNLTSLELNAPEFRKEKTRFIITGASGLLGHDIIDELHQRGEYDILALSSKDMDITNKDRVNEVINSYKPDIIFHSAAYTNTNKAETDEESAYNLNVNGTKNIVEAAKKVNAKIIYISSDYVFDGTKDGMYTEEDQPNPSNVYGKTKFNGEEEVKKYDKYFIVRTSWLFGVNGKNFVKTMLNLSLTKDQIDVVDDQVGSPTYTKDLAKLLVEMAYSNKYGIYHATNEGFCSWASFAEYIMELKNKNCKINKVTTAEYNKNNESAPRPLNSKLSKQKLIDNNFYNLPDYKDALDRYFKELEITVKTSL